MEAIILAAGYATRLYPLTENTPKPLLNIAGKPLIEHIIRKLEEVNLVSRVYIITNERFEHQFKKWLSSFDGKKPIEIINDGTKNNEDRLGALGDIYFLINLRKVRDDILIVAGDNLFDLSLQDVVYFFRKRKSNLIVLHDVKEIELAKKYGIVELEGTTVINFEEKPAAPKSTLASTGIYLFPRRTLSLIEKYISQGNNPDKTGNFIEWLHKRDIVQSYVTDKRWFDIGSLEELEKVNKHYNG